MGSHGRDWMSEGYVPPKYECLRCGTKHDHNGVTLGFNQYCPNCVTEVLKSLGLAPLVKREQEK